MISTSKVRATYKQRYRVNKALVLKRLLKNIYRRLSAFWDSFNDVYKAVFAAAFLIWFFRLGFPTFISWMAR